MNRLVNITDSTTSTVTWIAAALGILLAGSVSAQKLADASWWDAGWDRRFLLRTVPQGRRGGINVARFNLAEESDLCQPDGRDVRVVTPDGTLVPCEVRLRNNDALDVLFAVRASNTYFLYYCNPNAEESQLEWPEPRTGGLTLETRPLDRPVRKPKNLPSRWDSKNESFGSRAWGRVYELENPFGRDDFYLSRYQGTLYCPAEGSYLFSINADDTAALWLGPQEEPLCLRGPATPSPSWQDPRHPNATTRVELKEGIYRVRYYHAERYGSQLAALGWKKPSSELIETIPQDAYVKYLPTTVQGRQSREGKPAPYFVAEHIYNVSMKDVEHRFPHYRFKVRWPAASDAESGDGWTYRWDFGNGSTASGREVTHEFATMETRRITLTAIRGNERRSTTRPVSPPSGPVRHIRLEMRVRPESSLIGPDERLRLRVFLRNDSPFQRRVTLRARERRQAESGSQPGSGTSRRTQLTLPGGKTGDWSTFSWNFPVRQRNSLIEVKLRMHAYTVARKKINVLHTDSPLGKLDCGLHGELQDGQDRQVVLVRDKLEMDTLPPRSLSTGDDSTVRTVVVETGSGLPAAGNREEAFVEFFHACLEQEYPSLQFNVVRRAAVNLGGGAGDWEGFVRAYRAIINSDPNLVLLLYRPNTLLQAGGERTAVQRGAVLLEQVLTQSRAGGLAVGPPPLPGYKQRTVELHSRLESACATYEVPLATGFRSLMGRGDLPRLFRTDTRWGATSFISPMPGAQKLLATEACSTAREAFQERFEAAAQRAEPFAGAAGPSR